MIDRVYKHATESGDKNAAPWTVENINLLLWYVSLDNIGHLRGCYLTSKIDSSVFAEPDRGGDGIRGNRGRQAECKTITYAIITSAGDQTFMLMLLDGKEPWSCKSGNCNGILYAYH